MKRPLLEARHVPSAPRPPSKPVPSGSVTESQVALAKFIAGYPAPRSTPKGNLS